MKFTVVAVGKLKERFWTDACAEYLKRLKPYAPTRVVEVPDNGIEREAEAILHALDKQPAQARLVLLAIDGTARTSEGLSARSCS